MLLTWHCKILVFSTLNVKGFDPASTPIWRDYLDYLKSLPVEGLTDEGQKISSLRKLYSRALETPLNHLDSLWKDYENFENKVNKTLSKNFTSELMPKYNFAQSVQRQRKVHLQNIRKHMLAGLPVQRVSRQ
jgi:cleavage stimulation factor subunit 3